MRVNALRVPSGVYFFGNFRLTNPTQSFNMNTTPTEAAGKVFWPFAGFVTRYIEKKINPSQEKDVYINFLVIKINLCGQ